MAEALPSLDSMLGSQRTEVEEVESKVSKTKSKVHFGGEQVEAHEGDGESRETTPMTKTATDIPGLADASDSESGSPETVGKGSERKSLDENGDGSTAKEKLERVHSSNYSDLRKKLVSNILLKVERDQKDGPLNLWKYAKAANKEKTKSLQKRFTSIGSIAKNRLLRRRLKDADTENEGLGPQMAAAISGLFSCLPIFLPNNRFKSLWNNLILFVTFIIGITIPLQAGFGEEPSFILQIFDVLLDLLYIGDVVILFRSAIILDNKYIKDAKAIARSYMNSTFFYVDIMAALPVGILFIATRDDRHDTLETVLTVLRILKVLKIIKCIFMLGESFRKTVNVRPSDYVRMSALVFYLVLVTHWIACIYGGMCRDAKFPENFCSRDIDYDDLAEWYTHSFLWGITSLTGIEIVSTPVKVRENVFCIGVVFFGVFVYAAIIGNVNGIMSNQRFAETEFQRRVDSVVQYMNYRKVPEEHKKKVMMYYRILWARNRGVNEELLLSDLSRSLRSDTLRFVNTSVVSKLEFLSEANEDHINLFCERFISVFQLPGDIVATFNTTIDYVYFITRGVVESIPPNGPVQELKKGDSIGMDDMILGDKYTSTSRTKTFSDLVQLPKEHMLELIYVLPQLRAKVELILRKKKIEEQRARGKIRGKKTNAEGAGGAADSGPERVTDFGNAAKRDLDEKLMREFERRKDEAYAKRNKFGFRETLFAQVQEADVEEDENNKKKSSNDTNRRQSDFNDAKKRAHSLFGGMIRKNQSIQSPRAAKKGSVRPVSDETEETDKSEDTSRVDETIAAADDVVRIPETDSIAMKDSSSRNDIEVVDAQEDENSASSTHTPPSLPSKPNTPDKSVPDPDDHYEDPRGSIGGGD